MKQRLIVIFISLTVLKLNIFSSLSLVFIFLFAPHQDYVLLILEREKHPLVASCTCPDWGLNSQTSGVQDGAPIN